MGHRIRQILFGEDTIKLELLNTPVCELGLRLAGTRLGRSVAQVRRELRELGFRLRPHFYLSDAYGCVAGTASIGLGFWDANEQLRELNQEFRGFLWTWEEILQVLRHEVGHAFCYSYRLYRRHDFRELFRVRGHFFHSYPATHRFRPNPYSRDYVNPWGDHYAQLHPDEDFAETFCEWMGVRTWRRKYRRRPGALRKLEYVDRLVRELRRQSPEVPSDRNRLDVPAEEMRMTVREFFRASTRKYWRRAWGYIDRELRGIFPARANGDAGDSVLDFLNRNQARLARCVARAARVDPDVVRRIQEKVRARSAALGLVLGRRGEANALVEVTALLTTMATRYEILGRLR